MRPIFAFLFCPCLAISSLGADEKSEFSVRAGVRFLTPESAEVSWETSSPGKSSVAFGPTRKLGTIIASESSANFHRVVLNGLEPGRNYFYRIGSIVAGKRRFSPIYEIDGRMNYSIARY